MLENKLNKEQSGGKYLAGKKKRKKWLFPVILVAVIAGIAAVVLLKGGKESSAVLDLTDTTVLSYQDMVDSIAASGTVESASTTTVYSTMAYPVMAVHVEVGDYVEEGQLLAELDGKTLQNQITSQQIGLDTAAQSSAIQVENAQSNFDNFKEGIDQGLNASLNGARTQVDTAYDTYIRAKNTYERYAESLKIGENTTLIGAESALRSARSAYESAQSNFSLAQEALNDACQAEREALAEKDEQEPLYLQKKAELEAELETGRASLESLNARLAELEAKEDPTSEELLEIIGLEADIASQTQTNAETEQALMELDLEKDGILGTGGWQTTYDQAAAAREQAETALENAWRALDNAASAYDSQQATYSATLTTVDHTLADYQTAMESAWRSYQTALTNLASTEKTVQEQLDAYENNVESALIGAENASGQEALRQMQENLDDTKIMAPCSGTVTAVYAEVGGAGSGLLFIIEDVDDLVIQTSVKGYDVGAVQEGMKVVIRSDATGEAELDGVVSTIAPTANKNMQGTMQTASDPIFAAEVAVTSKDTGLRIGMEAELDYILAEEAHVLAVPYDAVYTNEDGQTCILAAIPLEEDQYRIKEIPVTTGLDDDLDMVVTGRDVEEGLRVIHEPADYRSLIGQTVTGITPDLHGMEAIVGGMMG